MLERTDFSGYPTERHVVDNLTFILGLDALYRLSMRDFEATRLLDCARTVAQAIGVTPSAGPVEGYYAESPALTEYFQLMRSLQAFDEEAAWKVKGLPEFSLMHSLAVSGCFGLPETGKLLPRGRDALALALEEHTTADGWSIATLMARAREIALDTGDFSLVALAARTGNAVAVTATRESVAVHASLRALGVSDAAEYAWHVDDDLSMVANRFIDTLNQFGADLLPPAAAMSAEAYYEAAASAYIAGRCIAIGFDPASQRYYHWAIAGGSRTPCRVEEFWDPELWTTSRYQSQQIIKGGW